MLLLAGHSLARFLMPGSKRLVDELIEAFDLNQRRKFELKNEDGVKVVDLYFKPITRADRKKAQELAGSNEALDMSTQMLSNGRTRRRN